MYVADRLTAFTFAAIYIFIPSLPVTHALGLVAHCPTAAKARHLLLYPFKGGKNHTIFQIISWVIWSASILVAVPVLVQNPGLHIPASHTEVLSAAAAVGSVFAEMFMIQSLLVFDPKVAKAKDVNGEPGSPVYNRNHLPSKPMAATAVVAMGALWVIMGGALIWATEYLEDVTTKEVYIGLSGACLLVGVTTTYGLGGKLWHAKSLGEDAATEVASAWRFFQPFRGGAAFVATQALGWLLFSASISSLLWLITQVAAGMAYCIRCQAVVTCSVMGAAYLVLGLSIWTFKGPQSAKEAMVSAGTTVVGLPDKLAPSSSTWRHTANVWLPILMLYTPVHIFSCVVVSSFAILPTQYAAAAWVGGLIVYYAVTAPGSPGHTGSREWVWLKGWLSQHLGGALRAWFGALEVIYDGKQPLNPHKRYVFGYQPHGLFPIGAPYLSLLPEFGRLFPRIRPVPLIASVCFHTPVVRDLCSWCGVRQVSRPTFTQALSERGSVILVPGGQAELVLTWRFFQQKQLVIYSKHKGFVRLAIEQGAALVPVLALGEIAALRNFFDMPALQQWTYKTIGFPIPYLVVGRWGLTPFPRRTGLRFVVGEPLQPPPHKLGEQVGESAVAELHKQYYAAVEQLYHKYQPSFPGYEDVKLVVV